MTYTLVNVKIIDQKSSWNKKRVDVVISDGRISDIGKGLKPKGTVIKGKNLHLSPGWIDMKVHFCDPGHEYKEDLRSGLSAAKVGGFTSVVTMPDTTPAVDNKSAVEYLLTKSKDSGVKVYPAACISKGNKGKELSEMIDLDRAGVKMFSDDKKAIESSSLMNRALLYAKDTGRVVSTFPQDPYLGEHGSMNEGKVSTSLGLTGIPHIAETIQLRRDIDLLRYTGSKLHVSGVSTSESVKLIKAAKKEGLEISAEVHLANLIWTDDQLRGYDTKFKLSPPLRSEKDRKALVKGVNDGTIDCISSDHRPEDVEHKKLEFGRAHYG
ncbi:MAG: dihydroorotase, partial [Flavobacteriales bacterium]|nr:dihydroorotase [Flavobacteriales bacterium]